MSPLRSPENSRPRRSLLFVPGSRPDRFEKATANAAVHFSRVNRSKRNLLFGIANSRLCATDYDRRSEHAASTDGSNSAPNGFGGRPKRETALTEMHQQRDRWPRESWLLVDVPKGVVFWYFRKTYRK